MKRLLFSLFALYCFLKPIIVCGGQIEIPEDLKTGADFLWCIVTDCDYAHKIVNLSNDPEFTKQLNEAEESISEISSTLEPEVDIIDQFYLDRGEQRVIYRIYSNTKGSRFYEIHILGRNSPPTIAGIIELSNDQVLDKVQGEKILTIKQSP